LQRIAVNAAAGISSIEQVTRLSVLNASADSIGINQRAHNTVDGFATSTGVLTDPAQWGAHHDLTGPVSMSWPHRRRRPSGDSRAAHRTRVGDPRL
jgi:hypothetical protein